MGSRIFSVGQIVGLGERDLYSVGHMEGSDVSTGLIKLGCFSVGDSVGGKVVSQLYFVGWLVGTSVASATGLVKLGCFSVGDSLGA